MQSNASHAAYFGLRAGRSVISQASGSWIEGLSIGPGIQI